MALAAVGALAGCATMGTEVSPDTVADGRPTCDAQGAQSHLGKRADQAVGAAILKDSGARTLRWGAPDSAWTMDYREDRVNVRYDDRMMILEITCG